MLRVMAVNGPTDGIYDVEVYDTRTMKSVIINVPSEEFETASKSGTDLITVVKELYTRKEIGPPTTAQKIEMLKNRNFNL